MADRSISISLEARVANFVSGMKTAQQSAKDFADRTADYAQQNEQHLDRVGKASMVLGGAMLAGIGMAVKSFMDFDSAMSEVEASTHETAANMELLREAAINAGADTAFSAAEAAKGIDEMAKAGVSTKDILNGGLTGALNLAAAGSLDVATAAELAASALTQFGLKGKDIPHLADLLAAGAGKAQGSVADMGAALNQAGLVASSTGLTVEETTGALAAFASAGLTGSDAGTSFKTMLMSLNPNSAAAATLMNELGIKAYDAEGSFIGMSEYAGVLQNALKGMGDEQRNATLKTLFGSDAVRAANVLYEQGAEGIAKWEEAVNDAGYAAVTASIKQDNLAGDIEKLGGSLDSVFIKSGSGVAESLRGLVQGAEDMVDAFGKIPTPILNAGAGIAGITGVALLLGGGLMTALPKVVEFKDSFDALADKSPRAAAGIGKVAKAAGMAAAAMVALQVVSAVFTEKEITSAEEYGQALLKVNKAASTTDTSGLDSLFTTWDKFAGEGPDIRDLAGAVKEITNPHIPAGIQDTLDGMFAWTGSAKNDLGQVRDRFKGLGDEMGNLAKNGAGETAAKTFQALTKEFEANGQGAKEALDSLPGYKDALLGLAFQAGVTLEGQDLLDFAMGKVPASMQAAAAATDKQAVAAEQAAVASEAFVKGLEEVGLAADGSITKIDAFAQSLFNAGLLHLSASDATIAYQAAIDAVTDSIVTNGKSLDENEPKGRANLSTFNGLAKAAMAVAEATATETLATQGSTAAQAQLQTSLDQSYKDLIIAAGQFDITGDAADTMARKALGIPKEVPIKTWVDDKASATLDAVKGKADTLDGRQVLINIREETHRVMYEKRVQEADGNEPEGGGLYGSYAEGGALDSAPGPKGVDSKLFWGAKGEHVLTDKDVDAMGGHAAVYAFRASLHSGGTQYAPASAPARTVASVASSPVNVSAPAVTVMIGNEQLDSRMYRVADTAIQSADSNSRHMRRGR